MDRNYTKQKANLRRAAEIRKTGIYNKVQVAINHHMRNNPGQIIIKARLSREAGVNKNWALKKNTFYKPLQEEVHEWNERSLRDAEEVRMPVRLSSNQMLQKKLNECHRVCNELQEILEERLRLKNLNDGITEHWKKKYYEAEDRAQRSEEQNKKYLKIINMKKQ